MKPGNILLNEKAKTCVLELCKKIASMNKGNEVGAKMARDMAKGSQKYGCLTPKQFAWLHDNAKRNNIKWVPELRRLLNGPDASKEVNQGSSSALLGADIGMRAFKCLRRIEKLLEERLPV